MPELLGNIKGIKRHLLESLQDLHEEVIPAGSMITPELAEKLCFYSEKIGREIAIYANRRGVIEQVAVGDRSRVSLPQTEGRRNRLGLIGLRCIHTHPGGNSELSELDLSSLLELQFDCMCAIAANADGTLEATWACLNPQQNDPTVQVMGTYELAELAQFPFDFFVRQLDKYFSDAQTGHLTFPEQESVIIAGLEQPGLWDITESLDELERLVESSGAQVVGRVVQKRDKPDSALYLGKGKLDELNALRQNLQAQTVIFDDELSPAQQRNLEQTLGTKIVDRTGLILDIFAQRARTYEGKLQVELAQMKYLLPRLQGQGLVLSRLGGGIGTRGPGETKLEMDRRKIRTRMHDLEKQTQQVRQQRLLHRQQRSANQLRTCALVGYTNAGKSTLLNVLTKADVYAENRLFATLDPTTRRLELPCGRPILLTDTVGFIHKLPHQLVAAFRATLEEVLFADLLIHVVDLSHPYYEQHMQAVMTVLKEIGAEQKPILTLFNKVDQVSHLDLIKKAERFEGSIALSALELSDPEARKRLLDCIENLLFNRGDLVELLLPYDQGDILPKLYQDARVCKVEYEAKGIQVQVQLTPEQKAYYKNYEVGDE